MALNVRVCVLDFTYCIISVLIDERYAAGLGRIDYRLLAALLFPPKLTLSLVRSRFVCFFLCFSPRLWFPKSTHQAPQAPPRVNLFSARCPGFFWDDPTGNGFSPPLFAMLLCAVIALLRTLLDGHFSSSSFFFVVVVRLRIS